MNKIISVEVWPKRQESGAFQVRIQELDAYPKTTKWFNGEKIRPAKYHFYATWLYSLICRLVERSAKEGRKITWRHDEDFSSSNGRSLPSNKGAYANDMRNRAIGACE